MNMRLSPPSRLAWAAALCLAACAPGLAHAAQYTFDLSSGWTGTDGLGRWWRRVGDAAPTGPNAGSFEVGWLGDVSYRSALDFDITRLPGTQKIKSATLLLMPVYISITQVGVPIGTVRHLDAGTPLPDAPLPTAPSDPRRFTWDALGAAPIQVGLGLGGRYLAYNPFDVTSGVAADHLHGWATSPFALVENPERRNSLGQVIYEHARLVVETEAPSPVRYQLQHLGGQRYKASYSLLNELSLPLGLLDIDFDTRLYDEDSLSVSLSPAAAGSWSAELLASGIGVPATLSLARTGAGLAGGEGAFGFDVEFDWLGTGTPGAQPYTVYDAGSFDTLYGGTTIASVPLPPQLQLMCIGLAGLAAWRGRKEQA